MRRRVAYITFPEQHGSDSKLLAEQKRLRGVNIRFNIKTFSQIGIPATADITIWNLNRKDTQYLSTSASTWLQKQNLISLYAGYDDNVKLLASGQIMEAIPTGNPDIALHIKVLSGAKWLGENMSFSKDQCTISDLLDDINRKTGWKINTTDIAKKNPWWNKQLQNFSFTGSPYDLLAQIQEMTGGFSLDKNGLNFATGFDEVYTWGVDANNGKDILLVNKNTGMIDYPQPTTAGVIVKTLLNPSVHSGQIISLTSERSSFVNGLYCVSSVEHTGELRANDWYTTLNCARVSGVKESKNEKQ